MFLWKEIVCLGGKNCMFWWKYCIIWWTTCIFWWENSTYLLVENLYELYVLEGKDKYIYENKITLEIQIQWIYTYIKNTNTLQK